jgi:hypothetical protein
MLGGAGSFYYMFSTMTTTPSGYSTTAIALPYVPMALSGFLS